MDVHDAKTRSYNMSRIKSKGTKPEEIVRKYLFHHGLRYRKNVKDLPGHPDIVLPKYKTIIFVNGCFWHMHNGCKFFKMPATNVVFWEKKFIQNKKRDDNNINQLYNLGWNIITIWECELKYKNKEQTLYNLLKLLKG